MPNDPSDRSPVSSQALSISLCAAAAVWCTALWLGRRELTASSEYFYFLYNLGLAVIPLLISTIAFSLGSERLVGALWLLWLPFFPNAPYLLTDLIHLRPRPESPFWADWIFMVSCAGTGLLFGCVSLRQFELWLRCRFGGWKTFGFIATTILLTGFGIYLGRFPRWNSWDILAQPGEFFAYLWDLISRPHHHPKMVAYSFGVAVMFGFSYGSCFVVARLRRD